MCVSYSTSQSNDDTKQSARTVPTVSTDTDQRLRRELKEKNKMLEEKLKLLRSKEMEFRKVCLVKDKAAKEVRVSDKKTV